MAAARTLLSVLLALLALLAQPLCLCRAASAALSEAQPAGCCDATDDERPLRDPCGDHGGECDCASDLVLVPVEAESASGNSAALAPEVPIFLAGRAPAAPRTRAFVRHARPPAPPGSARHLPLRL